MYECYAPLYFRSLCVVMCIYIHVLTYMHIHISVYVYLLYICLEVYIHIIYKHIRKLICIFTHTYLLPYQPFPYYILLQPNFQIDYNSLYLHLNLLPHVEMTCTCICICTYSKKLKLYSNIYVKMIYVCMYIRNIYI
jgi:hypothetical protein